MTPPPIGEIAATHFSHFGFKNYEKFGNVIGVILDQCKKDPILTREHVYNYDFGMRTMKRIVVMANVFLMELEQQDINEAKEKYCILSSLMLVLGSMMSIYCQTEPVLHKILNDNGFAVKDYIKILNEKVAHPKYSPAERSEND